MGDILAWDYSRCKDKAHMVIGGACKVGALRALVQPKAPHMPLQGGKSGAAISHYFYQARETVVI